MAIPSSFPAIKGRMGEKGSEITYYLLKMPVHDLVRDVRISTEIANDNKGLQNELQRTLKKSRSRKEISRYLAEAHKFGERFMGSFVIASWGGEPKFVNLKPDLDDEDINDLARAAALGNLGALFIVGDLIKGFSDFYVGDKAYAEDIGQGLPVFELASQFNKKYARWERLKPGPLKDEALLQLVGTGLDLGGLPGSKGFQAVTHLNKITGGKTSTDVENFMRSMGYSEYIINKNVPEINRPPANSTREEVREWNRKNKPPGERTRAEVEADRKRNKKNKNKSLPTY